MMKKTRKIILSITFAACAGAGMYAQQTVVPPSQAASSVGQGINSPVSLHTGTINVDIPVWTLTGKSLNVPVSLSYNGSGVKYNQEPGLVGKSWALNAGGMISRVVRGLPDGDVRKGWLANATRIFYSSPWALLDSLAKGTMDDMPDLYYFNCNGFTGKFLYDENGDIRTIPYQPVKIIKDSATKFRIIAPDGTTYTFGGNANAVVSNALNLTEKELPSGTTIIDQQFTYYSEWYLTRIETADASDHITFNYIKSKPREDSYSDNAYLVPHHNNEYLPQSYQYFVQNTYQEVFPGEIIAQNSKMIFVYENNDSTLTGIKVTDLQGDVKRHYTMVNSGGELLALHDETSGNPPYFFEYMPSLNNRSDHWGYVTDSTGGTPSIACLSGILTRVNYPTGGYKEFQYNLHTNGTDTVGGARIEKIITSEAEGMPATVQKYTYANMRYQAPPKKDYIIYQQSTLPPNYPYTPTRYYRSFIKYPFGNFEGSHVGYTYVTVLEGETGQNGKTVYSFANDKDTRIDLDYPYAPATSMEWKRGLVNAVSVYRKQGGQFKLVSTTTNEYAEDTGHRKEIYSLKVGYKKKPANDVADFNRTEIIIISSAMLHTLQTVKTYGYDEQNPLTTTTRYYYKPENNLVERVEKYISAEKKLLVTQFLYPGEYASGFPAGMMARDITKSPVETVTYMYENYTEENPLATDSLKVISGIISIYNNYGRQTEVWALELPNGQPLPMSQFRFSNQAVNGFPTPAKHAFSMDIRYYEKKATFDRYVEGNLVQYTRDNISHCTIYGYNHTLPVASVDNATYAEIEQALDADLPLVNGNTLSDAQMRTKLGNLQAALPEALVTYSTYKPVIGSQTSVTDINHRSVYFAYDAYERPSLVKDNEGNIVSKQSYENNTFSIKPQTIGANNISFAIKPPVGREVAAYKIYYKEKDLDQYQTIDLAPEATQYTLTGLKEQTLYVVKLTALGWFDQEIAKSAPMMVKTTGIPPAGLSVWPNTGREVSADGSHEHFAITCNQTWTVVDNANWITTTPTSGSGNGSFMITYIMNPKIHAQRTATITVQAGTTSMSVPVTQEGAECPPNSHWEEGRGCVADGE